MAPLVRLRRKGYQGRSPWLVRGRFRRQYADRPTEARRSDARTHPICLAGRPADPGPVPQLMICGSSTSRLSSATWRRPTRCCVATACGRYRPSRRVQHRNPRHQEPAPRHCSRGPPERYTARDIDATAACEWRFQARATVAGVCVHFRGIVLASAPAGSVVRETEGPLTRQRCAHLEGAFSGSLSPTTSPSSRSSELINRWS